MNPGLPSTGRIVVAAPETAVKIFDRAPEPERIFTVPWLPDGRAYVIDIDAMNDMLEDIRP